jgi:hypothetical protein
MNQSTEVFFRIWAVVPRHFNCRSIEVPILKSFASLGLNIAEKLPSTRASEVGQISAKTTFEDFLKRMGKEFQDEILGPWSC